jgi:hypothetical protein
MDPEFCEPVDDRPDDELLLGGSSWDENERSLKYAWRDKNGRRARGGELPIAAMPQAVLFAARNNYLTREQKVTIVKNLVDVLADD